MAETRRTLIPQFTVRWLLGVTAVMAVVSLVISQAVRGQAWAAGVIFGLAAIALAFVVYAAMFGFVFAFDRLLAAWRLRRQTRKTSPLSDPPAKTTAAILVALCLTQSVHQVWAVSGGTLTLPETTIQTPTGPKTIPNKIGVTLTIDTNWVESFGYRPVRVEVKSITGPVSADRVFTIRFRPMQGYTRYPSADVSQTVEIPAGATSVKAFIAVPSLGPWGMFGLDVYEGGRRIKELSIPEESYWSSWSGTDKGDSASPVTLLLDGATSPLAAFMTVSSQAESLSVGGAPLLQTGNPLTTALAAATNLISGSVPTLTNTLASPAELPTRWIDYSGFDVVLTSLSRASDFKDKFPDQWRAISNWVHSGGNLMIDLPGTSWDELEKLESLIFDEAKQSRTATSLDPTKQGWIPPGKKLRGKPVEGVTAATVVDANGNVQQVQFPSSSGEESAAIDENDLVPFDKAQFVMRRCGLGTVAAIRSNQGISRSFDWPWLYNTLGSQRWQWHQRFGVSLVQDNGDFWNFLIPGIGLAPVVQFQVLITLFVIVIGPVNYYLLRRWGKLNLTVLVVPAVALLITGALMLYAITADGLGVRLRARTFTRIDQRTGQAACWTRLSYYAGLAPSGLNFDENTVVIPLEAQPSDSESRPPRVVEWERLDSSKVDSPLEQKLGSGWLNSRTPTQFITARIRKSPARLEIKPSSALPLPRGEGRGEGASEIVTAPPQVKNHLGTPIDWLLLVDGNGDCFVADDVRPEKTAELAQIDSQADALIKKLQPLLNDNQPRLPPDINESRLGLFGIRQRSFAYQNNQRWRSRNGVYNNGIASPPIQGNGILEQSIGQLREDLLNNRLPPRSYVAIVESSPEMQPGTPAAHEEASFHLILGEW